MVLNVHKKPSDDPVSSIVLAQIKMWRRRPERLEKKLKNVISKYKRKCIYFDSWWRDMIHVLNYSGECLFCCFCWSWDDFDSNIMRLIVWVQREYFKQGKVEQFKQILEEGSSPGKKFLWYSNFDIPFDERTTILYFDHMICHYLSWSNSTIGQISMTCRNWWILRGCKIWENCNSKCFRGILQLSWENWDKT